MAQSISTMSAIITARAQSFVDGMRRAGDAMKKFASDHNLSMRTIRRVALAVGSAITTGVVRSSQINNIRTYAEAVGIGAQRFLEFANAAQIATDVTTGELQAAFTSLTEKIGAAAMGSERWIKFFEKLGVNIDKIKSQDPLTQFLEIADALDDIADNSQRTFVASKLFGAEMGKVIGLVTKGRAELEKMSEEQQFHAKMQLVVADEASEIVKSWREIRQNIRTISNIVLDAFAPALQLVLDITKSISDGVTFLMSQFHRLRESVIATLEEHIAPLFGRVTRRGLAEIEETIKKQDEIAEQLRKEIEARERIKREIREARMETDKAAEAAERVAQEVIALAGGGVDFATAAESLRRELFSFVEQRKRQANPYYDLAQMNRAVEKLLESGAITEKEAQVFREYIKDAAKEIRDKLAEEQRRIEEERKREEEKRAEEAKKQREEMVKFLDSIDRRIRESLDISSLAVSINNIANFVRIVAMKRA